MREYIKLCDVCDFQGGSQPPKDEWSFDFKAGYIRMLQIRDFTQSERVAPEYIKITKTTRTCEADDILIARYGASLGKILTGLAGAYNVAIMRTIPDTNMLEKKYLYYYLKSPVFQGFLLNVGSRAAQAGFNKNDLQDLFIPNLTRNEQVEIVGILERVETVIEARQKELQKLDDLIKARFIEMFGDPIRNPYGWYNDCLNNVCTKINDGTHCSPESFDKGDYMYITAKNIKQNGLDLSNVTYVSEKVHKPIYQRCNPEFGDILYIKDGATTGIATINTMKNEFTLLSSVALLKYDRSLINGYYLIHLLNSKEMYSKIRKNMGGAAITRLTIAKIKEIKVIVPPIDLQNQFADFVRQVDKSREEVKKSLEKTQQLYDSLMQEYFG